MSPPLNVRITDWADPAGAELRARQLVEIQADIEGEDEQSTIPSAEDIQVVIVLESNGVALATAGLRGCAASGSDGRRAAEVKRMFVSPESRGREAGVTGRLMAEVEGEARRRGFGELRLATGVGMGRARRFYEGQGFVEGKLFEPYLGTGKTVCYSKVIAWNGRRGGLE